MSILIKGMEMPKHDDEYVIFTVYGDGGVVYGPLNRPHVRYKNRAVPVPPHGRLIDADAVERNLVKMQMAQKDVVAHGIRKSRAVVRDMATIIPADNDSN